MERVNFRITLNLDMVNHQPAIYLKQSSIGSIRLTVRLQKDGKPYDVSDQCAVSAYALLPEEKHYLDDCKVEDGAIIYDIDKTIPAGKTAVEFTISEMVDGETKVLAAPTVYIISTAPVFDDSIPEATSDFSALQKALAEAKEYSNMVDQDKEAIQKAAINAYAALEAAIGTSAKVDKAVERANSAASAAESAAQAAGSKNTAGSIVEINKGRNIFLWYGTKEEYEAAKDTLPENTNYTIIDDPVMADYIVERDVSGIWTYEKWNSGVCKLYGRAWYRPTVAGTQHTTYNYPFTIHTEPTILINISRNQSVCEKVFPVNLAGNYTDVNRKLDVSFYDVVLSDYDVQVSVEVISTWK